MEWNSINAWNKEDELINVEKDTNDSGVEELEDQKYLNYVDKTYKVIRYVEETGLPEKGNQIRLITLRSFNAALFIAYICEKTIIDELLLVVYSINSEAALLIHKLVKTGKIKKCKILMSNLRNKAHRQKEQVTRDLFVNNPNIELFFASSHAKITSIKTNYNNHYTIEGSGNLSFNSRIESYTIDNNKELFDFTKSWMDEIKIYLKDKKELILT